MTTSREGSPPPDPHRATGVDVARLAGVSKTAVSQVFSGTVLQINGRGLTRTFTVRRLVLNEGVERVFPVNSPNVLKVVVKRSGRTRRAKLLYLRNRVGKATKLAERKGRVVVEGETPAAANA